MKNNSLTLKSILYQGPKRHFIEALGLKTPFKDQDLNDKIDNKAFKYVFALKDGMVFDQMRRLVIFD